MKITIANLINSTAPVLSKMMDKELSPVTSFKLVKLVKAINSEIPIINYCGIVTDETVNQTLDVINVVAICTTILVVSIVTYGKSAFEKFNTFIKN